MHSWEGGLTNARNAMEDVQSATESSIGTRTYLTLPRSALKWDDLFRPWQPSWKWIDSAYFHMRFEFSYAQCTVPKYTFMEGWSTNSRNAVEAVQSANRKCDTNMNVSDTAKICVEVRWPLQTLRASSHSEFSPAQCTVPQYAFMEGWSYQFQECNGGHTICEEKVWCEHERIWHCQDLCWSEMTSSDPENFLENHCGSE